MYYDYTILHGKFQAAVYALIDGIFHFFKHLPESNIAEDFSEIFFAYVMAYDDVFLPPMVSVLVVVGASFLSSFNCIFNALFV